MLHVFGRADSLDMAAIRWLVNSLCRFLSTEDSLRAQASIGDDGDSLRFVESWPMGGAFVLRMLWERLGLHKVIEGALEGRDYRFPVEWSVFAMVNRSAW